jgi:hypothetical protein
VAVAETDSAVGETAAVVAAVESLLVEVAVAAAL